MIYRFSIFVLLLSLLLAACGVKGSGAAKQVMNVTTSATVAPARTTPNRMVNQSVVPTANETSFQPTLTSTQTESPGFSQTIVPDSRLKPEQWQEWPVVPVVSTRVRAIFQQGQSLGNDANAFIKIGDCESTPTWFLGDFDNGDYQIAESFSELQPIITRFQGSYGRISLAAKPGFKAASVLSPFWADPEQCEKMETPLDCELRIINPGFALITLGTNDVWQEEKFEENLVTIVERLIEKGVVPLLSTKADNLEGDHAINLIIARVAYDYDLPLWNFWLAVQELPDEGLQEDLSHLTWAPNRFDDPLAMKKAWPNRNLTALQTLQSVWNGVQ